MGIFNDNSQNDHYGHFKVVERGPPGPKGDAGVGYELTSNGNYDIDGKRLTDVADSIGDNDAVNLKVLKEHTQVSQNNYHLQPSFKIFKDFGDKSQLTVGSPPNTSPDHFFQNHKAHNDAYIIEKEGYDTGFGGEAWSSIKIKGNQLESGSYTSIFEIFVIGDAGGFLVDDTIIYHVYGDSHYTINTFDSDKIDSQYTKSIIQFTTDGGAGVDDGIKFQIRYYGSQYNKNLKFLFYSRVIKGKQSTSFNHNIFNVSDVDDNHEILYFENLNMNSNLINGLGDPVDDADAANKKFVDTEIAKVHIDTTPLLPRNGSRSMTGNLNMGGYTIRNIKHFIEDDSSQAVSDAQRNQVINFGYFKDERGELKRLINKVSSDNVKYVNDTIENKIKDSEERSIQSVQQENIFKKVMTDNLFKEDDRIEFLSTINYNLLHRINHLTYLFRIKKDPPESYNGRLSIDLRYLPTGTYTMVFEMKFFPQIDHDKVSVNATSSSLNQVSTKTRVIKFDYGYYSRSIINFNKSFTNPGIDDLDIDLHLSLKDTVSPKPDKTSINVIVYGVKGTHSDIPIQTWDKLYDINNGTLKFEIPINMNGKAITNLKDPQPSDASYAASVNFVNKTVNGSNVIINGIIDKKIQESEERSIQATQQENAFKKVMDDDLFIIEDDDIVSFGIVEKDFHRVNQKTHEFKISYDSSIGYYSTRLGISVVYLPISYYTIVFEMYFSDKIDSNNITINANSGTLSVNKINTKISSNHTRSVINFYKAIIHHSDDELEIDMALKNKSGESYENNTNIFVVVYGVYGTQNDVNVELWDRYIYINNKKINFEAPIDMVNKDIENVNDLSINNELNMNNRPIKNVRDGNENSDAVNVKQLNEIKNNVTNYVKDEFGKVNPVLNNNSDLIKLIYRNLIRNDSKSFLIKELYFPDSIQGRTQNNYTYQTNGDNKGDVTFYLTFVHKATISDDMMISLIWESNINRTIHIFVSKDKLVISSNPLIDESSLKSYKIPQDFIGKKIYLWIIIQNYNIKIYFSGLSTAIFLTNPYHKNNDLNLRLIRVSDSPFTINRGLITKNIYNLNSDSYDDVREYERSEGTIIGPSKL